MDKIKELFENNPTKEEVFQTSDGYFFWEHARAQSHAATLENKKVVRFEREPVAVATVAEEQEGKETAEEKTEGETTEVDKDAEPSKYEAMSFAELKAEAKGRSIVVEGSQSKANFLTALQAADANTKNQA